MSTPRPLTPPAAVMTAQEFRAVREYLGLSQPWVAERLGVNVRSVRRWEEGSHPIPEGVRRILEGLEAETAEAVEATVAALADKPGPVYAMPVAPVVDGWPARWWRHVAMRVAMEVPGLSFIDDTPGIHTP